MKKEDLGYIQDRIDKLEAHYQKQNIGDIILKIAGKLEAKRPSLKDRKEVLLERAYALAVGLLEKSKGFDTFDWMIPVAIKGPSDWNSTVINEVLNAWGTGNSVVRDKLIAENRIVVHDGKPVSKVLKYKIDEDGSYKILEAEYVDFANENSAPLVRDNKKEFKPGSQNFNYGRPLYPRYHLDLYALVGIGEGAEGSAGVVLLRYQKEVADPESESFVGNLVFGKLFKKYDNVRAQLVKEDARLPVYDGNTSIWEKETIDPEIDLKIASAIQEVEETIKFIPLSDIQDAFKTFFSTGEKRNYDRLGMSEVTIKKTEVDKFGRTVLYLGDPSMNVTDMDIRGYVPDNYAVSFPVLPCQALITYYIKERDGKYDPKLHQRVDGKTYELGVTGLNFIAAGGLDESDKQELEDLLGE